MIEGLQANWFHEAKTNTNVRQAQCLEFLVGRENNFVFTLFPLSFSIKKRVTIL